MRRLLLGLFVLLSVDAQRFKLNQNVRDGVEISDVEAYQDAFSYRLPNNTRPESYVINLNFGDFHDDMSFTGTVAISIRVLEDTNTITLHSAVLVVAHSLRNSANVEVLHAIRDIEPDDDGEFLIIETTEMLLKDASVQLTLSYQGTIGTSISGVYRGSYLHDTERRWQLSTRIV